MLEIDYTKNPLAATQTLIAKLPPMHIDGGRSGRKLATSLDEMARAEVRGVSPDDDGYRDRRRRAEHIDEMAGALRALYEFAGTGPGSDAAWTSERGLPPTANELEALAASQRKVYAEVKKASRRAVGALSKQRMTADVFVMAAQMAETKAVCDALSVLVYELIQRTNKR